MNPLDFRGPQFLLFYAVYAAVVYAVIHISRIRAENGYPSESAGLLTDPYEIAFLRGGKNEVIRVATFTLVERGILRVQSNDQLQMANSTEASLIRDPIEQGVLQLIGKQKSAKDLLTGPFPERALALYEQRLKRQRLLPDAAIQTARLRLVTLGLLVLWLLAGAKVAIALSRGRTNVGFLIVMALAAGAFVAFSTLGRMTVHGKKAVADLEHLFQRLRDTAGRHMEATELALFAAVFGMAPVAAAYPWVGKMYQKAAAGGSSGSGCGASCGSGSSCGGGCGGGCGGCGG
jgi:uncharacterized protein (TIGR04222 family)